MAHSTGMQLTCFAVVHLTHQLGLETLSPKHVLNLGTSISTAIKLAKSSMSLPYIFCIMLLTGFTFFLNYLSSIFLHQ